MANISDIKSYEIVDGPTIGSIDNAQITLVIPNPTDVEIIDVLVPTGIEFVDIGIVALGSGATDLNGLTDVVINTPSNGQVLKFNGTSWVNGTDATGSGGGAAVESVNGQTGIVVLDADDIPDGTTNKAFTATEETKLAGVATGATANDTDANLKNRANHTGAQAISTVTGLQTALDNTVAVATFNAHTADTANPHAVTKAQVGLGSVDNTSDASKPISTATQAALDGKAASSHTHTASQVTDLTTAVDARIQNVVGAAPAALDTLDELAAALGDDANFASTVTTNLAGKSNVGHTHIKSEVGLANVDNTSDANKPVSTAQQTALDGKQTLDTDLTAIAAIAPANDDVIQRKAGVWVNRTMAQIKTDLALVKADVGLSNVDNTSDANKPISTAEQTALNLKAPLASPTFTGTVGGITKAMVGLGSVDNTADSAKPVSTAQQAALDGKQPIDSDLTAIAALVPTNDDVVQRKAGAWVNRTPAQLKTDLVLTKTDVGLANVDNTSDANKPVSTATQTALNAKAATTVVPDGGLVDEALVKVDSTNRNTTWKRMIKWFGDIVTLPNSLQQFLRVNIPDDASDTATWPDRLVFYFNGVRTGYHNEYGEVRSRAAKASTVALRAQGNASNTVTDVFQATSDDNLTIYFGAGPAGLKGPGTIRAISATQPSTTGWVAGEFWYDTSTEV